MFAKFGKALVAIVAAALTVAYGALTDGGIDATETVQIAIAVVTATGVYLVPITPSAPWGKTAIAALLAALQVLTTAVLGGLDPQEWIAIVLAAATALGVAGAPAISAAGPASRTGTGHGRSVTHP